MRITFSWVRSIQNNDEIAHVLILTPVEFPMCCRFIVLLHWMPDATVLLLVRTMDFGIA